MAVDTRLLVHERQRDILLARFYSRDMNTTDLIDATNQIRTAIWAAFVAWAFTPVLCKVVGHGQVVLMIHEGQLRDVHVEIGIRSMGPPRE